MADCPFCREGWRDEEKCTECDGEGFVELSASDPVHLIDDPSPGEVFELARLIFYAREKPWAPIEYSAQSAIFIQAYEIFLSTVHRYIREAQDKERKEGEMKWRDPTPSKSSSN